MPNIPLFKVFLPPRDALMPRLEQVLYSGQISEGEQVVEFERRFAEKVGSRPPHSGVLSFQSGTAALHGALVLAGVQPGDEVISTPMTAEPTNMAILHAGAKIVWADVDPANGNLDAAALAAKITDRTRAVMAVHYGGIPVGIDAIRAALAPRDIPLVEDAAHALGARYAGKPVGTHSEFVMFSLQAIKHMTTIDGGMLVCNSNGSGRYAETVGGRAQLRRVRHRPRRRTAYRSRRHQRRLQVPHEQRHGGHRFGPARLYRPRCIGRAYRQRPLC